MSDTGKPLEAIVRDFVELSKSDRKAIERLLTRTERNYLRSCARRSGREKTKMATGGQERNPALSAWLAKLVETRLNDTATADGKITAATRAVLQQQLRGEPTGL